MHGTQPTRGIASPVDRVLLVVRNPALVLQFTHTASNFRSVPVYWYRIPVGYVHSLWFA